MRTKKQIAAAAAAAAAAAEKKNACTASATASNAATGSQIKKSLKRLQSKAKEVPPKSIDPLASANGEQQSKQQQPQPHHQQQQTSSSKGKLAAKSVAIPKSPVPTKPSSHHTELSQPPAVSSSPAATVTRVSKTVRNAAPSGADESSSTHVTAKIGAKHESKKVDTARGKKGSTPIGGDKKAPAATATGADRKKIQKELKNLGITDRAINQIDTATVECNPSISEMVKTKSRATVMQQKYSELGFMGGPMGSTQKATATAGSSKQEGSLLPTMGNSSSASEHNKPAEAAPSVATSSKKKSTQKTKDTTPVKEDPKREVAVREEGVKNKTSVTALPTPFSSSTGKEDVKVPAVTKNTNDSKTKAKKTESKDDNDGTEPKSTKRITTVPRPKTKSKKAVANEERKAVELAKPAGQPVPVEVVDAKHTESKPKFEEEKTCSLEIESDEKNEVESRIQSRIEDIVKALEEEDEEHEPFSMGNEINLGYTPVDKVQLETGERKQTGSVVTKPKSSKADANRKPRKAPAKKKKHTDSGIQDEGKEILNEVLPSKSGDLNTSDQKFMEKPAAYDISQQNIESTDVSSERNTNSSTKRKYVKKPKEPVAVVQKESNNCNTPNPPASSAKKKKVNFQKPSDLLEQAADVANSVSNDPAPLSVESTPVLVSSASNIERPIPEEFTSEFIPPEKPTASPEHPKTIRSSTENDDDVPLNRLKDQVKTQTGTPEKVPTLGECTPTTSGSLLAAASQTKQPAKVKRKYIRKNPSSAPTSGGKKKPQKEASFASTSREAKDSKAEKKDVYDFVDDSESDIESPVKAGKPIFKRKPLDASSLKADEDEGEQQPPEPPAGVMESLQDVEQEVKENPPKDETVLEKEDSEDEKKIKRPLNKPTKSVAARARVASTVSSDSDESDNDDDDDNDAKGASADEEAGESIKQEMQDSSDDSDGYSSEESVRTRIVKKRQNAKKRHVKLYGFWTGPKRHRMASLNAIAKVHCLYENESRAALEASLMKQTPARVRPSPSASKEVKKEKIEESERKEPKEEKKVKVERKKDSGEEKRDEEEDDGRKDDENKQKEINRTLKEEENPPLKEEKKKTCKKSAEPKEEKKKEGKKIEVKEEKKDDKKQETERRKEETGSESESDESSEEEVVTRTLRCVPGLRGAGKHWDPNASSMESEGDDLPDSDETYAQGKDTDPVKKRKVKRKAVAKKAKPKAKSKAPAKKIKKETKAAASSDAERQTENSDSSSSEDEKAPPSKPPQSSKAEDAKKRKREPKEKNQVIEVLGKKRMASLNATAMLAATYEVQRILYRNTDSDSDSPPEKPKPKKAKEQKETKDKEAAKAEEKKEGKTTSGSKEESKPEEGAEKTKSPEKEKPKEKELEKNKDEAEVEERTVTIKTEPLRDRNNETEIKHELEEPRPVSSNVVIAQDTEVTITGVYVNSTLGTNQEAYCKMQYRVQQSVTEERLVRPGEAPPKSYTPLTALSSMRPPADQNITTPPLFGSTSQCESPLSLGPPRSFYPPPTSSSGSSSAFCAPIPHDSPGYYQPAGPLISPHLLPQPPQGPPSTTSQHSTSSSSITKHPPESDSPVQSLIQPPSSSTADSTDSDVLLTGGDLTARSQPYRYGPSGPPNLYPRPIQMHCPPPHHLASNYYAAPPYSQYPPEMYYTHAYPPAHFYPKFAQYYPGRRYYPGHPGPADHLYEQPPPPSSAPVPPPAGAQLVPAGPQGPPQHMEHYPGPPPYPYPGYGSPGPGPGGQCYSRNLQPPPYMDAHYTTNCPCPMQSCPKNVNAGSLIGIKASKGPVTAVTTPNHHHIATTGANSVVHTSVANSSGSSANSYTTNNNTSISEPIVISSGSSTSSSPPPLDIHSPITPRPDLTTSSSPVVIPPAALTAISSPTTDTAPSVTTAGITAVTTTTVTTTEPNIAPIVKPESRDSHQLAADYHLHHHHYHHLHRPSAPPPTHPLHNLQLPSEKLLSEVKEEPSTPTLETESKSMSKNIPKLLSPLGGTTTLVKQEIAEIKQEPKLVVVTCKKEDFEENGPAMTPDLLFDEALIKKEGLMTELLQLQPGRVVFADHQKFDDKSLLSTILTAEADLMTGKGTPDSDCCSGHNINNNNSVSNDNSSISNEKVQLVDSILPDIPASMVKRRPLLVACKKTTPKKSPPNSYKNLIKRTNLNDDNTITVLSDDEEEEPDEQGARTKHKRKLIRVKPRKLLRRTRRLFGTEQLRHLKKFSKINHNPRGMRRALKRPSCIPKNPEVPLKPAESEPLSAGLTETIITIQDDSRDDLFEQVQEQSESRRAQEPEERTRPQSNVDLTIDMVAKGYFSEPEIFSSDSRLLKKLKQQEGRSQSEQNRGKRDRTCGGSKHHQRHTSSKKARKLESLLDADFDKRKSKSKLQSTASPVLLTRESSPSHGIMASLEERSDKGGSGSKKRTKKAERAKLKLNSNKKLVIVTSQPIDLEQEREEQREDPLPKMETCTLEPETPADDRETDFDDAATMLVDDDVMSVDTNTMITRHNNNNNIAVENKNARGEPESQETEHDPLSIAAQGTPQQLTETLVVSENKVDAIVEDDDEEDDDDEEEVMLAKRFAKKGSASCKRTSRSRSKSKSRKFSTKKRHRIARVAEVEEVIVPRKCNSVPRWSNGWTWEGPSFQGKVFLNSDDPPVLRTCYFAMRHSEGDIIKPRDCVLLRAGSKRAELPYVAKVAHLWENPEDGEMMMSLLWYYRPEHTEQGRQPTDGPDEVFASRHKDHNSVACIEDKCYVLTFSEYCRFRRLLKGFEENIEEHPSIVPPLRRENVRLPPPIVSPELVMYCQRVYEFRLKRLLKTHS
ncbi:protein piccolo-like [Toxorhynchites rutilus septentrionalis]|uniref:protein piccolo-like n=1 Tax=Toxorhynchites rutilus septentrionalis TaxID=329112 RepID=UPI00247A86E0|nr:protein piccolo-like [Toxorhynchites rutilus septentrionalis]